MTVAVDRTVRIATGGLQNFAVNPLANALLLAACRTMSA